MLPMEKQKPDVREAQLNFKVKKNFKTKIDVLASALGISKSKVIERAIDMLIEKERPLLDAYFAAVIPEEAREK